MQTRYAQPKPTILIKLFTSFRKDLYLLFFFCIAIILLIELWWINIPEFFHGGELIGKIVLRLLYTVMAAVVFYFFGVYLNEYRRRKQILDLLKKYAGRIKDIRTHLLNDMYFIAVTQNNGEVEWPTAEEEMSLENHYPDEQRIIALTNNLPLQGRRFREKNWMDRIYRIKGQIEPLCDAILKLDNNLKANEISLIGELMTCDLFPKVEMHKNTIDSGTNIANENISFIRPEIQEFLFLTERINKEIVNKL